MEVLVAFYGKIAVTGEAPLVAAAFLLKMDKQCAGSLKKGG